MCASKLAGPPGMIIVIVARGVVATGVGCSSDDDTAGTGGEASGVTFDSDNNIYAVGVTSSDVTALADYHTEAGADSAPGRIVLP